MRNFHPKNIKYEKIKFTNLTQLSFGLCSSSFFSFFIFLWKMDQTRHKEKTKSKNYGNFSLQDFCVLWFSCVISHWKVSFHSYLLIKYLLMHEFLRIFLKETINVWEAIFQGLWGLRSGRWHFFGENCGIKLFEMNSDFEKSFVAFQKQELSSLIIQYFEAFDFSFFLSKISFPSSIFPYENLPK